MGSGWNYRGCSNLSGLVMQNAAVATDSGAAITRHYATSRDLSSFQPVDQDDVVGDCDSPGGETPAVALPRERSDPPPVREVRQLLRRLAVDWLYPDVAGRGVSKTRPSGVQRRGASVAVNGRFRRDEHDGRSQMRIDACPTGPPPSNTIDSRRHIRRDNGNVQHMHGRAARW